MTSVLGLGADFQLLRCSIMEEEAFTIVGAVLRSSLANLKQDPTRSPRRPKARVQAEEPEIMDVINVSARKPLRLYQTLAKPGFLLRYWLFPGSLYRSRRRIGVESCVGST